MGDEILTLNEPPKASTSPTDVFLRGTAGMVLDMWRLCQTAEVLRVQALPIGCLAHEDLGREKKVRIFGTWPACLSCYWVGFLDFNLLGNQGAFH